MASIVRMSPTEFRFEYETSADALEIKSLKEFEHEGERYYVKKVIPAVDIPNYHSYVVVVK